MLTISTLESRGYTLLGTGKTVADWEAVGDTQCQVELIDGELWMSPPPAENHQYTQVRLCQLLLSHVDQYELGMVYTPVGVRVSPKMVLQPDLVFVAKSHPQYAGGWLSLSHPPELAVEIVSPTSRVRDWVDKTDEYSQAGVKNYWIVEPSERSITAFRLVGSKFVEVPQASQDAFSAPPFPGLTFPVSKIFR